MIDKLLKASRIRHYLAGFAQLSIWGSLCFYAGFSHADGTTNDLGQVASNITSSFSNLAKLITAGAYMAGIGFMMASMLKFKAHKDNPTQIPIGTPIALLFIGAALIFLPNIFHIAGYTIFGGTGGAGGVAGTTGLQGGGV
jgi:intracellular multiplication protein IcmD